MGCVRIKIVILPVTLLTIKFIPADSYVVIKNIQIDKHFFFYYY